MSDYISKSALIEELKNTTYVFKNFGRRESVGLGEVVSTIEHQPTVDEKEIIRKVFERVVKKLESELKWTRAEQSIECTRRNGYGSPLQSKNSGKIEALKKTIEILKEECGINE